MSTTNAPSPIQCLSLSTYALPPLGPDILLTARPGARAALVADLVPDVVLIDATADSARRIATIHHLSPRTQVILLVAPEDAALVTRMVAATAQTVVMTDNLADLPQIVWRVWRA